MPTFPRKFPDHEQQNHKYVQITPDGRIIYGNFSISLTRLEKVIRDPKASTWSLILLYPVSALVILVGMQPPTLSACVLVQGILVVIGGVWIAWISVRLCIRERLRIWVHHVFLALALIGFLIALLGTEKISKLWATIL
jgi:hypothetical protein